MSEKQVEQFLEYLRKRIDWMTKECKDLNPIRDGEARTIVKTERAEALAIWGAFRCILEGREP